MRVLILSCNTGEGHNSCAKALKEVFDFYGEECVIADGLSFVSKGFSRFLSWGHVFVYRHIPRLFSWGYRFTENHSSVFKERSCLYNYFARGTESLCKYIETNEFDTVICTHPFTALMMNEVKKSCRLALKTAFVATDYTCSPSVKESCLDLYFTPSDILSDEFECSNISRQKILASGIPIRQMFYKQTDKSYAKQLLGLSPHCRHVVMMCGSMGCGPIKKLTDSLTNNPDNCFELTVICGTNHKLEHWLRKKYGNRTNLHILGFVEDMSAMLDSADLYLTKPGGISVTEASAKNLPMLFINAVAGCEDYNSKFYVELGCAKTGKDIQELTHICLSLMESPSECDAMTQNLSEHEKHNASEYIYSKMKAKDLSLYPGHQN